MVRCGGSEGIELLISCHAVGEGEGVSQPYTSDLDYLEDNFQLIETLGKALKMEDDDDALLFRADQRKPEAVVRELRAKSRSLRAKITQKMEATRKLEGAVVCSYSSGGR